MAIARKFNWTIAPSGNTAMVIQALKTIGKDQIIDETKLILKKNFLSEEKEKLLLEGKQTTMWI